MLYGQANTHLESMDQELELLKQAPQELDGGGAPPALGERGDFRVGMGKGKGRSDEQMWKIDLNVLDGNGPLLDGYGHVSAAVSS